MAEEEELQQMLVVLETREVALEHETEQLALEITVGECVCACVCLQGGNTHRITINAAALHLPCGAGVEVEKRQELERQFEELCDKENIIMGELRKLMEVEA
jgi:hypothetical protein